MIAIVNVSKEFSETGWQDYVVKINQKEICKFKHKRSKGLADCLQCASCAVAEIGYNKREAK